MAKFLFTVWPFPGHIHPNVAIAHALGERGHEAAFYTGGSIAASLEGEGFRCFPFRQLDEARVEAIVLALDALSLQWWKARQSQGAAARVAAGDGRGAAARPCRRASRLAARRAGLRSGDVGAVARASRDRAHPAGRHVVRRGVHAARSRGSDRGPAAAAGPRTARPRRPARASLGGEPRGGGRAARRPKNSARATALRRYARRSRRSPDRCLSTSSPARRHSIVSAAICRSRCATSVPANGTNPAPSRPRRG